MTSLRKKLLIHGAIVFVMAVATWFFPPSLLFWVLGYTLFFTAWVVRRCVRNMTPQWKKWLFGTPIALGTFAGLLFLLIPFVLVWEWYWLRPDYAENLAEYTMRPGEPPLRNAAYFRNSLEFCCDGDISEEDFRKLAALRNWDLAEIDGRGGEYPVKVSVHDRILVYRNRYKEKRPAVELQTVTDGIVGCPLCGNVDFHEFAVWNRKNGRLYVSEADTKRISQALQLYIQIHKNNAK